LLKDFYLRDPEEVITLRVEEVLAMIIKYARNLA